MSELEIGVPNPTVTALYESIRSHINNYLEDNQVTHEELVGLLDLLKFRLQMQWLNGDD